MSMETTARELLAELERAHTIIHYALRLMTSEQKQEWAEKNDGAGLVESGITRFHERRQVIADAKAAISDSVVAVVPAQQINRNFPADNGQYMHRCCKCNEIFLGHKRRVVCAVCDGVPSVRPQPQMICPRCKVDRFKEPCHGPHNACPMNGEAQTAIGVTGTQAPDAEALQWAVKTLRFLMPGRPVGPHAAFEEVVNQLTHGVGAVPVDCGKCGRQLRLDGLCVECDFSAGMTPSDDAQPKGGA